MNHLKDHYATLGVPFGSPDERIKSAYRLKAFEWHPDVNHCPEAKERMGQINEAYSILSNPARKATYDSEYLAFFGVGNKPAGQRPLQQKPAANPLASIDERLTDWAAGRVSIHEIVESMTPAEKRYAGEMLHQANLWMPRVKAYFRGELNLEDFIQAIAKGERKAAMLAMTACVVGVSKKNL